MQLDASTIAAVGSRTAGAGAAYALEGRAKVMGIDLEEGIVRGRCSGSTTTYSTIAWFDEDRKGHPKYEGGQCSCPVAVDCKHSVALYMTAFGTLPAQPPPAATEMPAVPAWESALGRIFTDRVAREVSPLAIAFEVPPPGRSTRWAAPSDGSSLRIRPMQRGKRDRWIQSGADWNVFMNPYLERFPPEQARALRDLARAVSGGIASFADQNGWLVLDRMTAAPPWDLIRDARDAGVELIEARSDGRRVDLLDEHGEAAIDLVEEDGDVVVTARLLLPDGVLLDDVTPIGSPPVAIVGRAVDGTMTIAGFRRPASAEWRSLRAAGTVRVPATDRARFERTTLPRITAGGGWRSSDASFSRTPPTRPALEIDVEVASDLTAPAATLAFGWRYGTGDAAMRLPLFRGTYEASLRDGAAEAAVLAAVTGVLAAIPALVDGGRPAPRAALTGLPVSVLTTIVVPGLQALPDVEVRITGDLPEFRALSDPEIRIGGERGTDWLDLEVTAVVEGHEVSVAQLILALATEQEVLFFADGGYLLLDHPDFQRLKELLEEARALTDQRADRLRVSRLQLSWWDELLALGVVESQERQWVDALRVALSAPESAPPVPEGLHAELRPYQRDGYEWLARLRRAGLGGVLADDMGLGKTVQSLAMILDARLERPGDGPFVVVAPTSVVPNWVAEAARFTPSLRVVPITQTAKKRGTTLADEAAGADVVVTSYALFRLEYDDYAALGPSGLLLDEAQHAKNHQSKAFACAKALPAPVKFAVTGTPMENHLGELWAMFSIVAPGLLGSPKQFADAYRGPIEHGGAPELLERLRRRIAPFLLRRTKQEVATDLPPKQEQRIDVELNPAHRRVYAKQLQRERQRVLGLVDDLDNNRIEVLSALTRLRQIAIDPSLAAADDEQADSSKLDALLPLLEEATAEGHRTLVFSQFTRFLDRIELRLQAAGIDFVRLDGTTKRRAHVVKSFAEGSQPVFLISLKAGGVGLNLAMADYCVLTDPWWNPAAEAQAVDRAHRIGQTRPVVVYRLIAKDTIEEKVMALQDHKRELVADVLGGDGSGTGAISASDIRALLA